MERKFLEGLGLEKEAIDSIMKEHGKSVNDIKKEANKVEGLESQIEDLQKTISDRNSQLEELKKVDADALQKTIDDLQESNKNKDTEYQEKLDKQAKDFAIESYLRDVQARNPKAVKALLDVESITLKDEKLIGIDEQVNPLKDSDAYLFEQEENPNSPTIVAPGNPNGGTGTPNPFSKENWNLTEQGKLYKENPELYKSYKAQAGK